MVALAVAGGVAVAYYLLARLGLALLSPPLDVAVLWPASGIAAGIMMLSNGRCRPAIATGVIVGAVAANLMSDRNLCTALFKGCFYASEALVVAGLIERWFGRPFAFDDLHRVLGFVAAACLGAAVSALGGAATMTLFHTSAPFWDVWRAWFLADAVGIVMVAPLVIGLGQVWRMPPSRAESIEAVGVLSILALASSYSATHPTGSWLSFDPDAVVLPLLLWLIARSKPVFGIAGAFIGSLTVIYATTFGIGHFGDAAVPILERVSGAQVVITIVTLYTLVLAALLAERGRGEAELRQSNNRLQLALDCAELGTWSFHPNTGHFENDQRDRRIHGYGPEAPPRTLAQMRSQVHADDLSNLDAAFAELGHAGGNCRTEYRLAPLTDAERAGRERWVAMEGTVVRRANGRPVQLLGVTRDITERKHADDALRQREAELGEAQRLAHIGSWRWDSESNVIVGSEELFRIFGFDPATQRVPSFRRQRDRWYPVDDWRRLKAAVHRTIQTGISYELELQALRNGTPIWITARGAVVRNAADQIVGMRGTVQDITERKLAEFTLAERGTQLELASKAARVGSFSVDFLTGIVKLTSGCATIYGLPEDTVEMSRDDGREFVHPEDLPQLELRRNQALLAQQREFIAQFRIVRAGDREIRWIEARSLIFYDKSGKPSQLIGVSIDFTERKLAEDMLAERNLQLELAGKAGLVGSYAYDTRSRRVQISPGYAAIHGLPDGTIEITHSEWLAFVHPEDVERLRAFRSDVLCERQEEFKVDYRIVRCSGEIRWVESRGLIAYGGDGHAQRLIGVKIDVTERKRTEIALQASEAKFAGILGIAGDAILSIDVNQRVTLFNEAAERLFGYSRAEILGQSIELLIPTRSRATHQHHIQRFALSPDIARRMAEQQEVHGRRKNGEEFPTEASISKLKLGGEWVYTIVLRDITERNRAEERQRALVAELDHRVKNTLATVSSVVSHTGVGSRSVANFVAALDGRIRSMATTHELLSSGRWRGISLAELVRVELAPYATRSNTKINGPEVILKPEAGQAMAMVLHELATNAAKYGALSTKEGRVSIRWDQWLNGHPPRLVLEWQEVGGPPVVAPDKSSFGTTTIRDLIPYEFGGTVDLALAPEGVRCRVELPGDWFSKGEPVAEAGARAFERTGNA